MRKIIIITHGSFGKTLLEVATNFFGASDNFIALEFDDTLDIAVLTDELYELIVKYKDSDVLCLVDIKGGTPYNVTKRLSLDNPNVTVISGLNLGMLLQLIVNENSTHTEIIDAAKSSIGG